MSIRLAPRTSEQDERKRVTALILELCGVVLPGRNDDTRVSVRYHSQLLLEGQLNSLKFKFKVRSS